MTLKCLIKSGCIEYRLGIVTSLAVCHLFLLHHVDN